MLPDPISSCCYSKDEHAGRRRECGTWERRSLRALEQRLPCHPPTQSLKPLTARTTIMNEKVARTYGALDLNDETVGRGDVLVKNHRSHFPRPFTLMVPFLALILGSYYLLQYITVIPKSFLTIEQRANKILTRNPLIGICAHSTLFAGVLTDVRWDGHDDLLIFLRFLNGNHIYSKDFKQKFEQGGLDYHVDLPRIDKGKMGGAFWSAFMPCPPDAWNFSDATYEPCEYLIP